MRIWKWTLVTTDLQSLQMPRGARILSIQTQGANAQLWALCDENVPTETRDFAVYATGDPMPDDSGHYLGTYQLMNGGSVGHVFEVTRG